MIFSKPNNISSTRLTVSGIVALMTPKFWLTVAPSVFVSAVYGYAYSVSLTIKFRLAQA